MAKKKRGDEATPENEPQTTEEQENALETETSPEEETPTAQERKPALEPVEFPILGQGDATIKDVVGKTDSNILKIAIGTELATSLMQHKGNWGSVELTIRSNQSALPMAELEDDDDQGGLFDEPPLVPDPDGEPTEEELEGGEQEETQEEPQE